MLRIVIFFILLVPATVAIAADSQNFGEYTVDYTTFPSTLLSAEIAKNYGIKRSKYETLLNVFISKASQKGGVEVNMQGTAKNLMGQQQALIFMEIKEDNTVYYIAPVRVTNEDLLHFKITSTLLDDSEEFEVSFTKTLYKD